MTRVGTLYRTAWIVMIAVTLLWTTTAHALEWNQREVIGVTSPDDSHFSLTIERGGSVYDRESVVWTERILTDRTAAYSLEYDFGTQVDSVEPPRTITTTYFDRITEAQVEAVLTFARMEVGDGSAREQEDEVFAHSSWDPTVYELTEGVTVPFDAERPTIGGDADGAVLTALHYDPSQYRLTGSSWLGATVELDGKYTREALYTVERRASGQRAIYEGTVSLPDTLVYDGVATYSAVAVGSVDEWERDEPDTSGVSRFTPKTGDPGLLSSGAAWALAALVPAGGTLAGLTLSRRRRRSSLYQRTHDLASRSVPFAETVRARFDPRHDER